MTDWIPSDSPGPGPAYEGNAEAPTPLAAALLLGLTVPADLRDRLAQALLSGAPRIEAEADGLLSYAWNRDGVWISLIAMPDGTSRVSCRIARVTHTVQGETVRREVGA